MMANEQGDGEKPIEGEKPAHDREAGVIGCIAREMRVLDQEAQERVALWVAGKYGA